MSNDTKVTYGVVLVIIIFLAGLAYMLKPVEEKENTTTAPVQQETTTSTTTNQVSQKPMEEKVYTGASIITNKGTIEVEFGTITPNTVKNFGTLASKDFYNGVRFHRVIKGFMIQAGDPLSKDSAQQAAWGTGGPGYEFNDELTGKEQYPQGTLAMANAGPNTNGSQFFIVTANPGVGLEPKYTVFGKVTKGLDIALAIENVKTNSNDRPLEDVIIQEIVVR